MRKFIRDIFSRMHSKGACAGGGPGVQIEGGRRIVLKERGKSFCHAINIEDVSSVGYMTSEASPVLPDFFLLVNACDVTYVMPMECEGVLGLARFFEDTLPGYDAKSGLANSIHFATLTVWPPMLAGSGFHFLGRTHVLEYRPDDCGKELLAIFVALLALAAFIAIGFWSVTNTKDNGCKSNVCKSAGDGISVSAPPTRRKMAMQVEKPHVLDISKEPECDDLAGVPYDVISKLSEHVNNSAVPTDTHWIP